MCTLFKHLVIVVFIVQTIKDSEFIIKKSIRKGIESLTQTLIF